jgi:hypothetical protein
VERHLPAYKAYLRAGYSTTVATAMTESSNLLRNHPKVRARLRELVDTLAERQMNTRETLVAE